MQLRTAIAESETELILEFDQAVTSLSAEDILIHPPIPIFDIQLLYHTAVVRTAGIDIRRDYVAIVRGVGTLPVRMGGILNSMRTEKTLGHSVVDGFHYFRVFAPQARSIALEIYDALNDTRGDRFGMTMDADGVWEAVIEDARPEQYYCYRVQHVPSDHDRDSSADPGIAVADPYGRNTVSRADYRQESRTSMYEPGFDWGADSWVKVAPGDAIIYEMHVSDLTRHPSSGCPLDSAGSFQGLMEEGITGGLEYLKKLGVNVVELLPCQHFARFEPPFQVRTPEGFYNSWNPTARNYWGYMTSYYFSPEPSYASGMSPQPMEWMDPQGRHIQEFKSFVAACHRLGIAVVMDVVYNHTSHYNVQPFKELDHAYYYYRDSEGRDRSLSGCGNDFHTSRPMARRFIIDSLVYWMTEYHIDGFRFDLGAMIDVETFTDLAATLRALHPEVLLITEPWGGGQYDPRRFSEGGISVWNDIFRNSVKGFDPQGGQGYIFGTWGWNSADAFGSWIMGSTDQWGGPLRHSSHSVNYLESHDGYTLGDFIRIALGIVPPHGLVTDLEANARLSEPELKLHKLAVFLLSVSQGAMMIHQGQEFARSKVIADRGLPATTPGMLDHNSYNKDDETNWLNFHHAEINAELLRYYTGMIALRSSHRLLRHARPTSYRFLTPPIPIASGFHISPEEMGDREILVLVNANRDLYWEHECESGEWQLLVDATGVYPLDSVVTVRDRICVPPSTGVILIR